MPSGPPRTVSRVKGGGVTTGALLRMIVVVVCVLATLYVAWLLRKPLGWVFLAIFVALALAAPVRMLDRRMPRGAAIAAVYIALIGVPVLLGALIVPSVVEEAAAFASDVPEYVDDLQGTLRDNDLYQRIDDEFDVGSRLDELAKDAPDHVGDAAGVLSDIGLGVVNSLFAFFTILILSAFMLANGDRWVRAALRLVPGEHRERTERGLARIALAVSGYVRAQMTIALIAAITSYVVMAILGVPFREPLAVLVGFASLIPVVGAPLWGVSVGLVTLIENFPTTTIIWVIWALAYPQFENYVLQPQLQKRAVQVEPFVIIVAVLFGGTLLGIVGALLAIPAAAAIQIVLSEWWSWRQEVRGERPPPGEPEPEPAPA